MTAITSNPLYNPSNIPSYLIAEQLDVHVFYYKGYRVECYEEISNYPVTSRHWIA